jgi:hypothetical protein
MPGMMVVALPVSLHKKLFGGLSNWSSKCGLNNTEPVSHLAESRCNAWLSQPNEPFKPDELPF